MTSESNAAVEDVVLRPDPDAGLVPLHEKPWFRGRLHQVAAVVAAFGLAWIVHAAPSRRAAVAAWVYGLSAVLLYLTSATYHVFSRSDRTRKVMRRLDHSMIYILIAGTFTPICVLAMSGWWRWIVLGAVWAGALAGAGMKTFAGHRFPRFGFALYLVLGWAGLALFPTLWARPALFVLVLVAGLLYTAGAIMFSLHWPLPKSRWFGYHEVWHTFVIVAGVLLFIVNFTIVSSAGS